MPNSNNNTSLDQLNAVNSHDFVTIYSPKTTGDVATLINILQNNREYFIEQIAQRGVLLFRGFSPSNPTEFHDIITQGFDPATGISEPIAAKPAPVLSDGSMRWSAAAA